MGGAIALVCGLWYVMVFVFHWGVEAAMTARIRIIKQGRPAVWQLGGALRRWEAQPVLLLGRSPSRRLNPATLDRKTALEKAKAVARAAETH